MAAVAVSAVAVGIGGTALWLCWMAMSMAVVAANYAFFGKHGFQKCRNGQSSWAAVWLLAPYRWSAWLNSRWWTRGARGDSEVVPGVWLGRVPAAGAAPQSQPWASALDLTAELNTSLARPLLALPMLDLVVPDPATLRRAAIMLEAQRSEHGSVLVFCALGYSRSAAAVATWLLLSRRADHLDNALALIRSARPHVVLHPAHQDAVARAAGIAARAPFEVQNR
jgi:protein-tyrosine phosphatase